MRLAASNIAWPERDDADVASMMLALGYEGLEIAPTRVWAQPLATSAAERTAFRAAWERRGLRIVAMQALVFNRPELTLFGDPDARERLARHLDGMIELAADLGAHAMVFGSPKNRATNGLSGAALEAIAVPFLRRLGDAAAARGVSFCVEPNPPQYGCDFVTTVGEALALVDRVGHPGFGLHLDAGGMTLTGGAVEACRVGAPRARHFHASEPGLEPVGHGGADHAAFAAVLHRADYSGWVSVEMRAPSGAAPLAVLERSLEIAAERYGEAVR